MIGICAICETQHELEFLESGVEEGTAWEDFLCPVTGETFTHLHSPTKHAPDVVESVASIGISPASAVSASEAESKPATTQVM